MPPSSTDIALLDYGDSAWAAGDYQRALAAFVTALKHAPEDLYAWCASTIMLAQLEGATRVARSLELLAQALMQEGQPLLAILALRTLHEHDAARSDRHLADLAQLYGKGSTRLGPIRRLPPPPPEAEIDATDRRVITEWLKLPRERQLEHAHEQCGAALQTFRQRTQTINQPVPAHILLSQLEADDLVAWLALSELRWFDAGQPVLRQGDTGSSLFVLVRGTVTVSRDEISLAELHSGAVFGEMSLLTQRPRFASVSSHTAVCVLEWGRQALEAAAKESPTLATTLAEFTRARLLRNLLATSPLFQRIDADRRRGLIELFESRLYDTGEAIVSEGAQSEGLHVVLSGEVRVSRQDEGEALVLATLGPGDVFGEISLLKQRPATASVVATTRSVVLCLPRQMFNAHVADYPEVLAHAYALALEREASNDALEQSRTVVVDEFDGSVLL